jgi:hypothetical protein
VRNAAPVPGNVIAPRRSEASHSISSSSIQIAPAKEKEKISEVKSAQMSSSSNQVADARKRGAFGAPRKIKGVQQYTKTGEPKIVLSARAKSVMLRDPSAPVRRRVNTGPNAYMIALAKWRDENPSGGFYNKFTTTEARRDALRGYGYIPKEKVKVKMTEAQKAETKKRANLRKANKRAADGRVVPAAIKARGDEMKRVILKHKSDDPYPKFEGDKYRKGTKIYTDDYENYKTNILGPYMKRIQREVTINLGGNPDSAEAVQKRAQAQKRKADKDARLAQLQATYGMPVDPKVFQVLRLNRIPYSPAIMQNLITYAKQKGAKSLSVAVANRALFDNKDGKRKVASARSRATQMTKLKALKKQLIDSGYLIRGVDYNVRSMARTKKDGTQSTTTMYTLTPGGKSKMNSAVRTGALVRSDVPDNFPDFGIVDTSNNVRMVEFEDLEDAE